MTDAKLVTMRPEHAAGAARLHLELLPDTLGSRLGAGALERIYWIVAQDPSCRCVVALEGDDIAGLATATLDLRTATRAISRGFSPARKLSAAARLLTSRAGIREYLSDWRLERFLRTLQSPYRTILTIGVEPRRQGRGLGKVLLAELDAFFSGGGEPYFVHTRVGNAPARRLYESAGFVLAAETLGYAVYKKAPNQPTITALPKG